VSNHVTKSQRMNVVLCSHYTLLLKFVPEVTALMTS